MKKAKHVHELIRYSKLKEDTTPLPDSKWVQTPSTVMAITVLTYLLTTLCVQQDCPLDFSSTWSPLLVFPTHLSSADPTFVSPGLPSIHLPILSSRFFAAPFALILDSLVQLCSHTCHQLWLVSVLQLLQLICRHWVQVLISTDSIYICIAFPVHLDF